MLLLILKYFCLITSAFKHHTNKGCYFTSSTLSTKITSSTRQKHKNVAPAAVTPLNIFCRERLSHDEDKGRVAVLFYSMAADLVGTFSIPMLQHRGPFEFPRRLIQTPALVPFFQLMERSTCSAGDCCTHYTGSWGASAFYKYHVPSPKAFLHISIPLFWLMNDKNTSIQDNFLLLQALASPLREALSSPGS